MMWTPNEDRVAIARAMLLGDRSFLDSQEAESFRETGSFHVLVVAGLNVGFSQRSFSGPEKTAFAYRGARW
jgi:predicted membrane metal-binding protein